MKIKISQLKKIIREELAAVSLEKSPDEFLHKNSAGVFQDDEGQMIKSKMSSIKSMAYDICNVLDDEDQLPGWAQDHVSVAHENLQQVHGYLTGVSKQTPMHEGHSRITSAEMKQWSKGNWGFVSETVSSIPPDQVRAVWEDLGGYEGSQITKVDIAVELGAKPEDIYMDGTGLYVIDGFVREIPASMS